MPDRQDVDREDTSTDPPGLPVCLAPALALLARRISVVPQLPGAKSPCVKWKSYQTWRPAAEDLFRWYGNWPDAGIVAVLGPVSDLFAVDVDGPEAHAALVGRLGGVPLAPTAISGSRKPHYHLLFRHPAAATKAKATPWHPNLEFRGAGGVIVLPPSLHASGHRYAWAEGRSLDDLPLGPPPPEIVDALVPPPAAVAAVPSDAAGSSPFYLPPLACRATREFLSGRQWNEPGWHDRLVRAACDLAGCGVPRARAGAWLRAGARPVDVESDRQVEDAVAWAYAEPRTPARGRKETP